MHYEESMFLDGVPGGRAVYAEDVSVEERVVIRVVWFPVS